MKKLNAIIIGASSGIGRELAKMLYAQGYQVGITARRTELLKSLQEELPGKSRIKTMDISRPEEAVGLFRELVEEMGGLDLLVLNAGTGSLNPRLDWEKEKATLKVNVMGFAALAGDGMKYFLKQKKGHLVGINSIAAIRGNSGAPAYNASKAFGANYLEGLRFMAAKSGSGITVTTIQPGFVDTRMALGDNLFWVAPVDKAARLIYDAIKKKKKHAYITKRWTLFAWLLKLLPGFMAEKIL